MPWLNAAEAIGRAVALLWPVVQQTADYIAGKSDQLPELPGTLKSRAELERAKARARK